PLRQHIPLHPPGLRDAGHFHPDVLRHHRPGSPLLHHLRLVRGLGTPNRPRYPTPSLIQGAAGWACQHLHGAPDLPPTPR
ncbi:hypothetical protein FKM82_028403, partial [Ascaphus truei]